MNQAKELSIQSPEQVKEDDLIVDDFVTEMAASYKQLLEE